MQVEQLQLTPAINGARNERPATEGSEFNCFVYAQHGHELMRWKSSVGRSPPHPDIQDSRRQLLANGKGKTARSCLEEAGRKTASWWTRTSYEA